MKEITLTLTVENDRESLVREEMLGVVSRIGADWSIKSASVSNIADLFEMYASRSESEKTATDATSLQRTFEILRRLAGFRDEIQDPPSVVSTEAFERLLAVADEPLADLPNLSDREALAVHALVSSKHVLNK